MGHGPRIVIARRQHVIRSEMRGRLTKVFEAQSGGTAATERDRRTIDVLLSALVALHGHVSFFV
jgi:hypothetical protein